MINVLIDDVVVFKPKESQTYLCTQSRDLDKGNVFDWRTMNISIYLSISARTYRDGGERRSRFRLTENKMHPRSERNEVE